LISNTPESNGFFRLEATTARYSRLPGRLIVKTPRFFNQMVHVFCQAWLRTVKEQDQLRLNQTVRAAADVVAANRLLQAKLQYWGAK
jgi:hypothetical protein